MPTSNESICAGRITTIPSRWSCTAQPGLEADELAGRSWWRDTVSSWPARSQLSRHPLAGKFSIKFLPFYKERKVVIIAEPLWPVFRFASRRDAIEFLRRACADYARAQDDERGHIFLRRCMDSLSQPLPKEWLVGTAWLFAHPESSFLYTAAAMTQAAVADNPDCDIAVNDEQFVGLAQILLGESAEEMA